MRRSLLFVLSLVLLPVLPAWAEQVSDTPATTQDSAASAEKMTPREAAELRADILMARKEYLDAARAYDEILKTDPNSAELFNKMGVAYQQLVDLNRAERCYKKAMRANKTFASAINNVGTIEYEKKHYDKAIGYYQKALELRVDMAPIYANLAYAYIEYKKYAQAMDAFGKAVAIDPGILEAKGGGNGTVIQQRTTTDPGLFYFFVAKSYAMVGDAERSAHYLKLSRDDGYKDLASAQTDPAFAKVIKDPRVQEVLTVVPAYATDGRKSISN
jgi:tetratricopeptide (TPR) repeat protein